MSSPTEPSEMRTDVLWEERWPVESEYEFRFVGSDQVVGQVLGRPRGDLRFYNPAQCVELPGELAKLPTGEEEPVLRFVERYGLLKGDWYGEPLWLYWHHARVTQRTLELLEAIKEARGNDDSRRLGTRLVDLLGLDVYNALRGRSSEGPITWIEPVWRQHEVAVPQETAVWETSAIPLASLLGEPQGSPLYAQIVSSRPPPIVDPRAWGDDTHRGLGDFVSVAKEDRESPGAVARLVLRDLLNAPQESRLTARSVWGSTVVQTVEYRNGRFAPVVSIGSPLNAVRWHLQQVAVGARNTVVKCDACGSFFIQTDRRMKFCPPPAAGEHQHRESLCGLRFRARQRRQEQKRKETQS